MNDLSRFARLVTGSVIAVLLAAVLLLGGCGPGVGGTGTGGNAVYAGSGMLGAAPILGGAGGTIAQLELDTGPTGTVLSRRCGAIAFTFSSLATSDGSDYTVVGELTVGSAQAPALLRLQFNDAHDKVTVTLSDMNGAVVAGPAQLQLAASPGMGC